MHCFSGLEGFPVIGDQAILQINPPARFTLIKLRGSEVAPVAQRCLAPPVTSMGFVFQKKICPCSFHLYSKFSFTQPNSEIITVQFMSFDSDL